MDFWDVLLTIHLLAMAFFVGGQLVLAIVLVPVLKGKPEMKEAARRFGHTSGVALLLSILTGAYLASHFQLWGDTILQVKLATLVVLFGVMGYHMQHGDKRWAEPVMATLSLAIVVLGVALAS